MSRGIPHVEVSGLSRTQLTYVRTFNVLVDIIINYGTAMFAWSRFLNDLERSLSNVCYIAQK